MTDFATQALLGSPTASLVGKDKGDVSNRAKCAGAQFVNNAKTLAADTVVIGGTVATLKAMKKGKLQNVQNFFAKLVDKVAKKLPKDSFANIKGKTTFSKKIKCLLGDIGHDLRGLPTLGKAVVVIAAVATSLLAYINHKNIYKSGQIDQKYTDKAKIEKNTKEMV